jgi:hypothetical protein
LRLSKQAGVMRPAHQREALRALGEQVIDWIAEPTGAPGLLFERNLRRLLGHETLAKAIGQAKTALRAVGKKPLWSTGPHPSPETALLRLHEQLLANLSDQTKAAEQRMTAILRRLAYSGKEGENAEVAARRLGYTVACLGTELLRDVDAPVLSTMREAVEAVRNC